MPGLVRGGTQRMVKLEISGTPQDKMYQTTSSYIEGLRNGSDELNLSVCGSEVSEAKWTNWQDILKSFGMRYFLSVKRDTKIQILIEKSEHFFQICDEAVGLSEEYSQRKATALVTSKKLL